MGSNEEIDTILYKLDRQGFSKGEALALSNAYEGNTYQSLRSLFHAFVTGAPVVPDALEKARERYPDSNAEMVRVVERVLLADKWIEIWLRKDGECDPYRNYDICSKQYMFWNAIERATPPIDTTNNGVRGIILLLKNDGHNWEIDSVLGRVN